MSTLSLSELDLTSGLWQITLDELYAVGVNLVADQWAALAGHTNQVMIAWALPDPMDWRWWEADEHHPLEVSETYGGPTTRPTIPAVFEIDWELVSELEHDPIYSTMWSRFPSLPGRVVIPDGSDDTSAVRFVRCWDQCSIDPEEREEILRATESVWLTSSYAMLRDWYAARDNELDLCDLADAWDRERGAHTHRCRVNFPIPMDPEDHHYLGTFSEGCLDGEATYGEMANEFFHLANPGCGTRPLHLEIPLMAFGLTERWDTLATTSRQHAEMALQAVYHDRDAARAAEQLGGRPWG